MELNQLNIVRDVESLTLSPKEIKRILFEFKVSLKGRAMTKHFATEFR